MLTFHTCAACGESHALRGDGRMSIHSTAAGLRCEGQAEAPERRPPSKKRQKLQSEIDRAFEYAHANRRGSLVTSGPVDRRIYATKGASFVSGGLPGTAR